jgi:hypothetical protein
LFAAADVRARTGYAGGDGIQAGMEAAHDGDLVCVHDLAEFPERDGGRLLDWPDAGLA